MHKKEEHCYMLVSDDTLQLPITTAKTLTALADELGVSYKAVWNSYKYQSSLRLPKGYYSSARTALVIRVELTDDED